MPYVVTRSCCADASCVVACPVNCIHPAPGEPGFATAEMLYVDPDGCVDCGACATACPVDAIKPHTALGDDELAYLDINAGYFDVFPHPDRAPVAVVPPQRRLRERRPVRVAVVGAGPAGLYAADELLKHPEVSVDVLERLPTPYGLVRAGVAPDHQDTKRAQQLFAQIETERGFRYRLGVDVGRDVSAAELQERYDAVVWSVGAATDRSLGLPGEQLPGSLSATELVGWYNGHPDHQDHAVDLSAAGARAVVVGNGNVALDVARVLTTDPDVLRTTDVAGLAWAALAGSAVREVVVLGRRSAAHAAYTLPELLGLAALVEAGRLNVVVDAGGAGLGDDRRAEVLARLAAREPDPSLRTVVLRFCAAPVRLLGEERVTGLEVVRTDADARPTGQSEVVATGLVLRSIGYRCEPVPGLPFDETSGTVPHDGGRVVPGTYVAGWLKRGPSGFIGTNKTCSAETVASLLDDLDAGLVPPPAVDAEGPDGLSALLAARGVVELDRDDWRAIDAEERRRGAATGRVRAKIVEREELLRVALEARGADGYAPARKAGDGERGARWRTTRRRAPTAAKPAGTGTTRSAASASSTQR
ncbi:MAG: FAD-dependent oxidoreductase [Nocardioides marinisabuli]|uniref:FAD-dependent oxidoreductase n=1 Tax=Nocardioides marinisabuli TaxID=419476 RepID=UPI00321B5444